MVQSWFLSCLFARFFNSKFLECKNSIEKNIENVKFEHWLNVLLKALSYSKQNPFFSLHSSAITQLHILHFKNSDALQKNFRLCFHRDRFVMIYDFYCSKILSNIRSVFSFSSYCLYFQCILYSKRLSLRERGE